jgi:predicted Zn-dependent protease
LNIVAHTRWSAAVLLICVLPSPSQGRVRDNGVFRFTNADYEVLKKCAALERQFEHRGLIYSDSALIEHLTDLARPILTEPAPERVEWRFEVLLDSLVYAFSTPGGSIYVTTGLLAALENDDRLAGILAHEIAHVTRRHVYRYLRTHRRNQAVKHILQIASSALPAGAGLAISVIAGADEGMAATTTSGYDREFEFEADEFAAAMLSKCGRDPTQIVRSIERLGRGLDPEPFPVFYTNATRNAKRVAHLRITVAEAKEIEEKAYLEMMRDAVRQNVLMDIVAHRFRTALARAKRLTTERSAKPEDLCLLAEAYYAIGPRTEIPPQQSKQKFQGSLKLTEEEEFRSLAATVEGQTALKNSQSLSEDLFREAIASDAAQARPHVGLGLLYQRMGRDAEAVAEYRTYLSLAPSAPDTARIARRLEALLK